MSTPDVSLGVVQAALYSVLNGDAQLAGKVWDEVPEGTAMPYVVIGESIEQPDNSQDRHGWQTVATLHIWSRSRGFREANTIASRVAGLLDHQPLTVAGRHHVATRYEFAQTLKDPEPGVRHVVLRFRVLTEEQE